MWGLCFPWNAAKYFIQVYHLVTCNGYFKNKVKATLNSKYNILGYTNKARWIKIYTGHLSS